MKSKGAAFVQRAILAARECRGRRAAAFCLWSVLSCGLVKAQGEELVEYLTAEKHLEEDFNLSCHLPRFSATLNVFRELPDMTSAKFSDFLTPSPLVRIWI